MPTTFTIDSLYFKPVDENDLEGLIQLDSDPEVRVFFPGGPQTPKQIKGKISRYQKDFAKNGYGIFAVFSADTKEFIGRAGFGIAETGEIEVGYLLLKKYWGQGYGTRILKILLAWAQKNIHTPNIIAYTPINHKASERVMQKAGMTYLRHDTLKGMACIVYQYSLT